MEIFYDNDFAKVTFSKENELLKLEWKKEATAEEYRNAFSKAFEITKITRIAFFISDIRKQGPVQVEEVQWLSQDILKKAIINGLEKIAVIMDDNSYSRIYLDAIKNKIRGMMVEMEYFNSENSAVEWIKVGHED